MRPTFYPILLATLIATLIATPALRTLGAQARAPQPPTPPRDGEVRIERLPQGMSIFIDGSNRAVLGVTLSTDSRADSNGVRIADVHVDGPAAKAGLKTGDVITEVNGTSLRVSGADATDPALAGIGQRRLLRALAKAKAGDQVDLRVQSGGSSKSVKVKTVSPSELDGGRPRVANGSGVFGDRDRPAIGVTVGAANNLRDTLGLFVSSVIANGPAELAGIVEGERIAAVNGVDVRVPREDVEDFGAVESRVNRFVREVQKGEAGTALTLRVFGGGRYREVSVTTIKSSALPRSGFRINVGDGGMRVFGPGDGMLIAPRPPVPPDSPDEQPIRIRERIQTTPRGFEFTIPRTEIRIDGDAIDLGRESIQRAMDEVRRSMQEMGRDLRLRFREDGIDQPLVSAPRARVIQRRTITIL